MRVLCIIIFGLIVPLIGGSTNAATFAANPQSATVDTVMSKVKERFAGINSIAAEFTQESKFGSTLTGTLTGKVSLQRPGKMKWVYSNGDVVTSDGTTTWIYQPDLNQVIESRGSASAIVAGFLTGMEDVKKDFRVSLVGESKDAFILRLAPKETQGNIKGVTIEISKMDYLVKKTIVEDQFGTTTEVSFKDMRLNEPLKEGIFEFKPPKGAKIARTQ